MDDRSRTFAGPYRSSQDRCTNLTYERTALNITRSRTRRANWTATYSVIFYGCDDSGSCFIYGYSYHHIPAGAYASFDVHV